MVANLYKYDASPPARAVMMTAHILKLDLNTVEINPVQRDQDTPELIKKNPMRTVPFLDEGDFYLADSHAIITYLVEKYGKTEHSQLYPKDIRKRAIINQRLFFDCGILFPRLRDNIMIPTFLGQLTEMSKSITKPIDQAYRILESYLTDHIYLADDVLTLADVSVVSTVSSLHGMHPINEAKFPKLTKWYQKLSQEEFFKTRNINGNGEIVKNLKQFMEFNKQKLTSKL